MMRNPEGTPIWYELMTADAAAATRFYDAVVGWRIGAASASPGVDYRMIEAGDGQAPGQAGGVMTLTDDMIAAGATPRWLFYVGVEDVDATVERARSLGAGVLVPPSDIPGVGRFAFLTDPQDAPFYVMRGDGAEPSRAFAPGTQGRCSWNELWTNDAAAAIGFYRALFGWENRETMDMGPMGGYHFLDLGETRLGAVAQVPDRPPQWNFYFTVADIDAAVARIGEAGGAVTMGPHAVPGGQTIVLGTDPQGAAFALVAPGSDAEAAA